MIKFKRFRCISKFSRISSVLIVANITTVEEQPLILIRFLVVSLKFYLQFLETSVCFIDACFATCDNPVQIQLPSSSKYWNSKIFHNKTPNSVLQITFQNIIRTRHFRNVTLANFPMLLFYLEQYSFLTEQYKSYTTVFSTASCCCRIYFLIGMFFFNYMKC